MASLRYFHRKNFQFLTRNMYLAGLILTALVKFWKDWRVCLSTCAQFAPQRLQLRLACIQASPRLYYSVPVLFLEPLYIRCRMQLQISLLYVLLFRIIIAYIFQKQANYISIASKIELIFCRIWPKSLHKANVYWLINQWLENCISYIVQLKN